MENKYDPKENYLKITNDFQDALCRIRISGEDRQILDAIIRLTFGYKLKWAKIKNRKFREMTGLNKRNVFRATKRLQNRRMIKGVKNDTSNDIYYRIETDSTQWRMVSKMTPPQIQEKGVKFDTSKGVKNDALGVTKTTPSNGVVLKTSLKDISLKTDSDDIIFQMSKTELETKKTELIEDRKDRLASNQPVEFFTDAINKIDSRLKQLSPSPNPSPHKISRSERKKISGKKRTRVERLDA